MKVTVNRLDKTIVDGKCVVNFLIEEGDSAFAIEKQITLVDGKSNESYTKEAYALSEDEIDAWKEEVSTNGREFDPVSGTFA